jgi:MFS family permease
MSTSDPRLDAAKAAALPPQPSYPKGAAVSSADTGPAVDTQSAPMEGTVAAAPRQRWIALAVLAAAQFMVFLDETVVNLALPSIKEDLGFSQAGLAWVVNAYMLTFGGLLLLGGRVGILLGGALTDLASWRWVFLINVPVASTALAMVPRLVAESRIAARRRFDVAGALTVTAGTSLLVYALLKTADYGWRSSTTYGLLATSLGLLGGFALIESRSAAPLLPAGFLHRRAALVPNVVQLLLGASAISTLFLLTLYVQQGLGYTPLEAGLAYVPLAASVAGATALANYLMPRLGPRPLAGAGLATIAAGLVFLGHAPVAGDFIADVLPGLVLVGLGAGLSFVSITTAALARVDEEAAGLASGLLSTAVMLGGASGLAVLAAVASARSSDLLGSGSTPLAAEVGGLQLAFLVAAAVSFAASLVALVAFPRGKVDAVTAPVTSARETTS